MKESVEQLHSRKSLRSKEKPASLEKDGKSTEIIERMQDLLSTVEKAKNVPSGKYNREQKRFLIYSESTKKGAHKGSPVFICKGKGRFYKEINRVPVSYLTFY